MTRYAMLIDLTRCIGCDSCTLACKQENGTPVDVFFARGLNIESSRFPSVKRIYVPVLCNHCQNPACLRACPNKAIFRRDDGIVLIDQERCRGAGACVSACPYGNIILTDRDEWYLPNDRAYERDFVRPRLREQVARKCTFCAHRVDQGLEPACVVACPTTARIFGDLENPESRISTYIESERAETSRRPFKLLPEAGTEPANCYLGTMASQEVRALPVEHATPNEAPSPSRPSVAIALLGKLGLVLLCLLLLTLATHLRGASGGQPPAEIYGDSSCAACHGPNAMGALGPPLAQTNRSLEEFTRIARQGQGMMPATPVSELSDAEIQTIYEFVRAQPFDKRLAPISYKIGQLLTTHAVGIIFSIIGTISILLMGKTIAYWLGCAGIRYLWPDKKDLFIDNGLTLGADYFFLVVLQWTILTGFVVEAMRYGGVFVWVQPMYILHLGFVAVLLLSAPFTRFAHMFVVPILMALTRIVREVTAQGPNASYRQEPSPGRHHKSIRIASQVLKQLGESDAEACLRLRYFP